MKYLKVFNDFAEITEQLSDAEIGRLFRAMMKYAETGQEPSFSGNERFLWGAAKKSIDLQREAYKKQLASLANANKSNPNHNGNPMEVHSETDGKGWKSIQEQEQEEDKDKENNNIIPPSYNSPPKPKAGGGFAKPSVDEIRAYCLERKNGIDPEAFYAFYESNGWKVGKNPMKNWKMAMVTWEKSRKERMNGGSTADKPISRPNHAADRAAAYAADNWHYDN